VWSVAVIFFVDILDAMNRALMISAAILAGTFTGQTVFANDASGHASTQTPTAKRQTIKDCMSRKMTADRSLSYNAAAKVCTALVKPPPLETASNNPVK